jgi:hypothetical protein
MKVNKSCSEVESMSMPIQSNEKLSFRHDLFKLVKSTHILHLPLDFFTSTTFANQSG